jgi:hypothetical protein
MITRRWVCAVLVATLLALGGCGHDQSPRPKASPRTAASPVSKPQTPEELAANEATTAFEQMLRVTDTASQEPSSKDWEPVVRQYAADPAAYLSVQSIRDMATLGLRQEGNSQVDVKVSGVDLKAPEGPTVKIAGCYDGQSTRVVKAESGEVVPSGTPHRYVWDITVIQYVAEPGKPWLVRTLDPRTDQPC